MFRRMMDVVGTWRTVSCSGAEAHGAALGMLTLSIITPSIIINTVNTRHDWSSSAGLC